MRRYVIIDDKNVVKSRQETPWDSVDGAEPLGIDRFEVEPEAGLDIEGPCIYNPVTKALEPDSVAIKATVQTRCKAAMIEHQKDLDAIANLKVANPTAGFEDEEAIAQAKYDAEKAKHDNA